MRSLTYFLHLIDRLWVRRGGGHVVSPTTIGAGRHDCALAALYWTAPSLSERRIIEAFEFCTENWPYGGVTNREFQIALKYLGADSQYSGETETLGELLDRQPRRCVALVPGHFVAVVRGNLVGRDAQAWCRDTTVYCSWILGSKSVSIGRSVASYLRR